MKRLLISLLAMVTAATMLTVSMAQDTPTAWQPDFLELDGKNGLALIPDPEFSIADGGTIEFWVQPDWSTSPDYDPVVISAAGQEGPAYIIAMLRDQDGIALVSGDKELVWAFDFSDGEVHHVAINIYAKEVALIIDGISRGIYDMEMASPLPSAVWIGSADGNTGAFKGAIAALRIWSVPVEPKVIDEYRYKDVLSEAQGNHPDIDYLQVVSDFRDRDVLIVEAEETVGTEDKK